ncbi:MAG TPA: nucleotide sugar dehydrogenase [Galbitalea sp.]|jgi:nucleotide sugar dehydrogenase
MSTITRTGKDQRDEPRRSRLRTRQNRVVASPGFDFDVAVVGLGYVGLPTAISYYSGGSRVLGLDASEARLGTIVRGDADLLERDQSRLAQAMSSDHFLLTSDAMALSRAASVVICVPTPVDDALAPDLRALRGACETVVRHAVPGQLLMLTSTTYVGCTDDLLVKPLEQLGYTVGTDIFVAFSAERIDPGNDRVDQEAIPRVVGGATPECEDRADALLHRYAAQVHHVGSLAAAEMTKLMENTFRAVNIALANEFADICAHLGIPVNDVIDAAATKPYGFMAFRPGPGVGGHCIPCDPHYLLWQLRKDRISAPLIERTMTEIASRPGRIVDRARDMLADRGVPMSAARILVVGVSYKPDVADLRESPALEILSSFARAGADVGFVDDHFEQITLASGDIVPATRRPEFFGADLVLIHTHHTDADLRWIADTQLVLDPRFPDTESEVAA